MNTKGQQIGVSSRIYASLRNTLRQAWRDAAEGVARRLAVTLPRKAAGWVPSPWQQDAKLLIVSLNL